MKCNIDRRGRIARLICGLLTLVGAAAVGWLLYQETLQGGWTWGLLGFLVVFGCFQLYEAKKSWCVMRAMGFRTPM